MIPQEKIEQAVGEYRDGLLKEKNRTTGQFVGMPLTHKQIESQVEGYAVGMAAGVRFAEGEIGQTAQEFAEWINNNRWYAILSDSGSIWRCGTAEALTTTELFSKFEEERITK